MANPPTVGDLREMPEGVDGLFVGRRRGTERPTAGGPGPGLLAVGHRLVPHCTPPRVQREPLDVLGQAFGGGRLYCLETPRGEDSTAPEEEAAVGHLIGQGMLEGECSLREQPRLVEELSGPCELIAQAGLADAVLSNHADHLPPSFFHLNPESAQGSQLPFPADESAQGRCA